MKRSWQESIHVFFRGYSDNRDTQTIHIMKRIIWLVFLFLSISCLFNIIKNLIFFDFKTSIFCFFFLIPPLFLIKLD